MIQGVDLTPVEMKLSHQRVGRVRFWAALLMAGCLANLAWIGCVYVSYYQAREENRVHQRQQEQIRDRILTLQETTRQLQRWESRLMVLDRMRRYPDYQLITGFLAQQSPALMVLTELTFREIEPDANQTAKAAGPVGGALFNLKKNQDVPAEEPPQRVIAVQIEGYAMDYATVADFYRICRDGGLFAKVRLKRTWRQTLRQENLVHFELGCTLRPKSAYLGIGYAAMQSSENL